MDNNVKFGDVLRNARQRSGEDLVSVARRIRIRPDILERIEDSDIDAMPPRGYSRNMINAYARYLGLNPTELVKMYQTAQYRRQVEHAREHLKPTGFDMPHDRREVMRPHRDLISASDTSRPHVNRTRVHERADDSVFDDLSSQTTRQRSGSRIGAVHAGSYNAYGQGLARMRASKEQTGQPYDISTRSSRRSDEQQSRSSRFSQSLTHEHENQKTHRARRFNLPGEHYTNLYTAPKNIGAHTSVWREKLPFILAGIVLIMLVVVIVVMANTFLRASTPSAQTTPINVTGLPDSQNTSSSSSSSTSSSGSESSTTATQPSAKTTEPAPTKAVMELDIPSGVSTYYEAYVDGKYVDGGEVTGPKKESYDITGTFELRVTPPDGVKLTQDGTEVKLTAHSGSGVASYKVDFKDILEQWKKDHESSSSSSSTQSSSAKSS